MYALIGAVSLADVNGQLLREMIFRSACDYC